MANVVNLKPRKILGPKTLAWLRENLVCNGVEIFKVMEENPTTRVKKRAST